MAKFLDESGLRVLWEQIKKQHEIHQADLVETLSDYATLDALNEAIQGLAEDLAGALNFVGVVDNLDDVENPKNGDIVLNGTSEYIYVEKDVSAERLDDLSTQIADATAEKEEALANLKEEDFENTEAYEAEVQSVTEFYDNKIQELQDLYNEELENPTAPEGNWVLIGDEGAYATKGEVEALNTVVENISKEIETMEPAALTKEEIEAICV